MARQLSVVLAVFGVVAVLVLVLPRESQPPSRVHVPAKPEREVDGIPLRSEVGEPTGVSEAAPTGAKPVEEGSGGAPGPTSAELARESASELRVRVVQAKADPQTPPPSVIWRRSWQAQAVIQDWSGSTVLAKTLREALKGEPVEAAVESMGFEPDWKEPREARSSTPGETAGDAYVYVYGPSVPEGQEGMPEPPWSRILIRVLTNEAGIVDDVVVSLRDDEEPVEGEQRQGNDTGSREGVANDPSVLWDRPEIRQSRERRERGELPAPAPERDEEALQVQRAEWERLMARFQQLEAEAEAQKEEWAKEYGIER